MAQCSSLAGPDNFIQLLFLSPATNQHFNGDKSNDTINDSSSQIRKTKKLTI